jgi:hypothetical protein
MALRLLLVLQAQLDPIICARRVVALERGRLILIHHQDVDIAIVVKITEGAASAAAASAHRQPGFLT